MGDNLNYALNIFTTHALDELPVVSAGSDSVTGILRKKDLVLVYTQAVAGEKKKGPSAREKR